jgi:hypothetical protein
LKKRLVLLSVLAGTAAIGTAAIAIRPFDREQPPTGQSQTLTAKSDSKTVPVFPAHYPEEVVDRLDTLLQPRFLKRDGEFGISRIYIPLNSHQFTRREGEKVIRTPLYALLPANADEKELIQAADSPGIPYVIGFLHSANTLGKPNDPVPANSRRYLMPDAQFETLAMHTALPESSPVQDRQTLNMWKQENLKAVNEVLKQSADKARKGEKVEAQAGDWLVMLRPVKASEAACLGCHGRAKAGDTLGVMAYAVRKPVFKQVAGR